MTQLKEMIDALADEDFNKARDALKVTVAAYMVCESRPTKDDVVDNYTPLELYADDDDDDDDEEDCGCN